MTCRPDTGHLLLVFLLLKAIKTIKSQNRNPGTEFMFTFARHGKITFILGTTVLCFDTLIESFMGAQVGGREQNSEERPDF